MSEIESLKAELSAERSAKINAGIRRYNRPEKDLRWEYVRILLTNGHPASIEAGAKTLMDLLPPEAKMQIALCLYPTNKIK